MSDWHAIMYPIRPGTEEAVRDLFANVKLPRRKVYDENGDVLAELLSTMVFVGKGRALRLIEFTGALPWIVDHLPDQAFFLIGGLEDPERKAKELAGR